MNERQFVELATEEGPDERGLRLSLVETFKIIHEKVKCLHCPWDAYHLADDALSNWSVPGPIAEFGCFEGGMTCKLSHVAAALGKQICVFDGFSGLPDDAQYTVYEGLPPELGSFSKGQFSCELGRFHENVSRHGRPDALRVHAGPIDETIDSLTDDPSLVFIDVDLIPTARLIIKKMWPRMRNCKMFTHEACLVDYMDAILDSTWWRSEMGRSPPQTGHSGDKGFGLSLSVCLNFLLNDER